jgi:hypothetical protein
MKGRSGAHVCAVAVLLAATGAFAEEPSAWSWSLSGTQYWLPHDPDFLLGVGTADRGALHLEARWQYEDLQSLSLLVGRRFGFGEDVHLDVTPIVGPLLGRTNGIVPGAEVGLTWRWLSLYTEDEYVVVPSDSSANYFYSWTELTVTPWDFLTLGVVGQRTRLVQTSVEIERGLLARLSIGPVTIGVYVFNPATPDWYVATGLTIER